MVLLRHISIALTAAVAALGSALFIAWSYFYRRRIWSPEMDYCVFKEEQRGNFHTLKSSQPKKKNQEREKEQRNEKQVLVLGLDGAGKSSVLQVLNGTRSTRDCRPTRGFNFMSMSTPGCQLDFLEIGGGEDLRMYWTEYLRKTHILVYVVDSSDRQRLPLAKEELHRLLQADKQLPVVVLGNKQDKPDAVSISELHDALSLGTIGDERRVFLLAAQLGSEGPSESEGLRAFQDLLLQLV